MRVPATRIIRLIVICIIIIVGYYCCRIASTRAGFNDMLLSEVRLLNAAYKLYLSDPIIFESVCSHEQAVLGRSGFVIKYDNTCVITNGKAEKIVFGWTNSILGAGSLLLSESSVVYFVTKDGKVFQVRPVDLKKVTPLWYIRDPLITLPPASAVVEWR